MTFVPPQPGDIAHAEIALMLNVLRADLAIAQHVLALRPNPVLAAVVGDLRVGIARLEAALAVPAASEG